MTHQLVTLFWIISNILTFHFYTFSVIYTFYFYMAFEELTFYQKCSMKCNLYSLFYNVKIEIASQPFIISHSPFDHQIEASFIIYNFLFTCSILPFDREGLHMLSMISNLHFLVNQIKARFLIYNLQSLNHPDTDRAQF